jgi:hypothetical protein
LAQIVTHNFRTSFHAHANTQRSYVLEDEHGLVLCSWPHGGRPRFPFVYSEEVWTGIEYHVASHLIATGDVASGVKLVAALRKRHDGSMRNPWNEVECGHHYARSMAGWMLLPATSGYTCNVAEGWMRFAPQAELLTSGEFVTPWFNQRGWGTYRQTRRADGTWQVDVVTMGGDITGMQVLHP